MTLLKIISADKPFLLFRLSDRPDPTTSSLIVLQRDDYMSVTEHFNGRGRAIGALSRCVFVYVRTITFKLN